MGVIPYIGVTPKESRIREIHTYGSMWERWLKPPHTLRGGFLTSVLDNQDKIKPLKMIWI
ncbi:hypothetical protein C5S36_13180 [Candidatus Methanophagaceae archaeon]|nr:hypothetical protein C5S36_13180 [Methanophagales archaeon]